MVVTALQGQHLTVAPLSEQRGWGFVKQLPTELLSVQQGSSLGMRMGGFEEHIPTLITKPPPLVISLWGHVELYSLHGRPNSYHTQHRSKTATSTFFKELSGFEQRETPAWFSSPETPMP